MVKYFTSFAGRPRRRRISRSNCCAWVTGSGEGHRRASLFLQLERISSSSSRGSWGPAVGHVVHGAGATCSCPGLGSAGGVVDGRRGLLRPSRRGGEAASSQDELPAGIRRWSNPGRSRCRGWRSRSYVDRADHWTVVASRLSHGGIEDLTRERILLLLPRKFVATALKLSQASFSISVIWVIKFMSLNNVRTCGPSNTPCFNLVSEIIENFRLVYVKHWPSVSKAITNCSIRPSLMWKGGIRWCCEKQVQTILSQANVFCCNGWLDLCYSTDIRSMALSLNLIHVLVS